MHSSWGVHSRIVVFHAENLCTSKFRDLGGLDCLVLIFFFGGLLQGSWPERNLEVCLAKKNPTPNASEDLPSYFGLWQEAIAEEKPQQRDGQQASHLRSARILDLVSSDTAASVIFFAGRFINNFDAPKKARKKPNHPPRGVVMH